MAMGIGPADTADRFPPSGLGPPFGADIAIGRARPPGGHCEHFAFLPRLALLPVVAQDPEAPAADRTPDRTRALKPFAPADPAAHQPLRGAIDFPDMIASAPFDPCLL